LGAFDNDAKRTSHALVNKPGDERRGYEELSPLCIEPRSGGRCMGYDVPILLSSAKLLRFVCFLQDPK
jgi:hypothetical protein